MKRIVIRRAFTLSELLVCMAIISILAALLIKGVPEAMKKTQSAQCLNNLRQLGVATMLYANENNGEIPYALYYNEIQTTFATKLAPYLGVSLPLNADKPKAPYNCPACSYSTYSMSRTHFGKNYFINSAKDSDTNPLRINFRFAQIEQPSIYYYLADSVPGAGPSYTSAMREIGNVKSTSPNSMYNIEARHSGHANILFMDMHAESVRLEDIPVPAYGVAPWSPRKP